MSNERNKKNQNAPKQLQSSGQVSSASKALIADNRPAAAVQRKQQEKVNNSASAKPAKVLDPGSRQPVDQNVQLQAQDSADTPQLAEQGAIEDASHVHADANPVQSFAGRGELSQAATYDTVQRLGIFDKIKKALSVKSVALGIEGLGHIIAGIVAVAAGGATAASLVGVAPGTVAIVGGVGQILIGVSKWVRAAIVGWANYHSDGKLSDSAKGWVDGLTGFEAAIGISSTVVTAGASALVGAILGGISSLIKLIRAVVSGTGGMSNKKLPGWIVTLESVFGVFSSLSAILEKGVAGAVDIIKMLVNYVKEFRGVATAAEAAGAEEQEQENPEA